MTKDTGTLPISDDELQFTFSRSGGPGGQNVNKVNTKATLRWNVVASPSLREDVRRRFLARFKNRITTTGELVLSSQRFREQSRNIDDCRERLAAMLHETMQPRKKRRPTKPTKASKRRRLHEKRKLSAKKDLRGPRSLSD